MTISVRKHSRTLFDMVIDQVQYVRRAEQEVGDKVGDESVDWKANGE